MVSSWVSDFTHNTTPNTRTQCQLPVMPVFQAIEINEEDPIRLLNALPVPSLRQFHATYHYLDEQVTLEKTESENQITFVSSTATEFQEETSHCSLLESHSVCKPTMVVTMTQFCSNSQTLCTLYTDTASCHSSHCQLPSSTGVMLHNTLVLPETYLSQSLSGITSVSGIHVIYSSSTNY